MADANSTLLAKHAYRTAKKNAINRKVEMSLTLDDMLVLAQESGGCCALSGIRFDFSAKEGSSWRRPFIPSVDRIDPTKGYVPGNVRLVCVAVNYAMSDWGEDVLKLVALGLCEKNGWSAQPSSRARPIGVVARPHQGGVRYEALISWNGKRHYLGCFRTAEEGGAYYIKVRDALKRGEPIDAYLPKAWRRAKPITSPAADGVAA